MPSSETILHTLRIALTAPSALLGPFIFNGDEPPDGNWCKSPISIIAFAQSFTEIIDVSIDTEKKEGGGAT